MAADEALLASALDGQASLRFYVWSEATVSLGYFQPAAARFADQLLAALPFVRRPSGGATLVHHRELTYCLALPAAPVWEAGQKWMQRMHRIIVRALEQLGLGQVILLDEKGQADGPFLCFQHFTPGDVLCRGKKIAGSAQRKQRHCLMQHGSILLAQSEHTPSLPGILELTGESLTHEQMMEAVLTVFEQETGWTANPSHWTPQEQIIIQRLIEERYTSPAWNEKR